MNADTMSEKRGGESCGCAKGCSACSRSTDDAKEERRRARLREIAALISECDNLYMPPRNTQGGATGSASGRAGPSKAAIAEHFEPLVEAFRALFVSLRDDGKLPFVTADKCRDYANLSNAYHVLCEMSLSDEESITTSWTSRGCESLFGLFDLFKIEQAPDERVVDPRVLLSLAVLESPALVVESVAKMHWNAPSVLERGKEGGEEQQQQQRTKHSAKTSAILPFSEKYLQNKGAHGQGECFGIGTPGVPIKPDASAKIGNMRAHHAVTLALALIFEAGIGREFGVSEPTCTLEQLRQVKQANDNVFNHCLVVSDQCNCKFCCNPYHFRVQTMQKILDKRRVHKLLCAAGNKKGYRKAEKEARDRWPEWWRNCIFWSNNYKFPDDFDIECFVTDICVGG